MVDTVSVTGQILSVDAANHRVTTDSSDEANS